MRTSAHIQMSAVIFMTHKISILKILIHLIGPFTFIGLLYYILIENQIIDEWILFFIVMIFVVLVLPQSLLIFEYLKNDWGRRIEASDSIIKFITKDNTYNLSPSSVNKIILVESGGYKNPLVGFGFIKLETPHKTFIISSLVQGYSNITRHIPKRVTMITAGYPSLKMNIVNDKEVTLTHNWITNLISTDKTDNSNYFKRKFTKKTDAELNFILTKKGMSNSAKKAAELILKERKTASRVGKGEFHP